MPIRNLFSWILRLTSSVILLQTLFFKFTASMESVYIFTKLGMEPWGRIGTGIAECIAAILIMIPYTSLVGALMGIGLMAGALFFHLTLLGIIVEQDGGLLFIYAIVVFICCLILAWTHRKYWRIYLQLFH